MTFFARLLASRFAGPLMIALAVAAIASSLFSWIQTSRLDAAVELAESRQREIVGLAQRIASDQMLIAQRDSLIDKQNAGVRAIQAQRAEDRTVYIRQYAAADERARDNDQRAAQIMALPNEQLDELAQCRASKILLEQELTQ
jgi:hypothetical protein